jgi:hypothetical protein
VSVSGGHLRYTSFPSDLVSDLVSCYQRPLHVIEFRLKTDEDSERPLVGITMEPDVRPPEVTNALKQPERSEGKVAAEAKVRRFYRQAPENSGHFVLR